MKQRLALIAVALIVALGIAQAQNRRGNAQPQAGGTIGTYQIAVKNTGGGQAAPEEGIYRINTATGEVENVVLERNPRGGMSRLTWVKLDIAN